MPDNSHLWAIVDIGSNGIRFSISSTEPKQARILPCLFQDRAAISLFDALYAEQPHEGVLSKDTSIEVEAGSQAAKYAPLDSGHPTPAVTPPEPKNAISHDTIRDVVNSLLRFKNICKDFGVPNANVRVIATEATREAPNSAEFRQAIKDATSWEVLLLSKQDEGRIGAYGVASSFHRVQGLFMDLGGGSCQVSWITCARGEFQMSPTPVSLPYGAAALTRRLKREDSRAVFDEMRRNLAAAVDAIQIPEWLSKAAVDNGGFKIYVCGGGYRGLGHLLLARHPYKYPLPIINGFSCTGEDIINLFRAGNGAAGDGLTEVSAEMIEESKKVFRISERRATQLPAVALLVQAALSAFPPIRKVLFSQGGVREGALFHDLPNEIKLEDPLLVATRPYAPILASRYTDLLQSALPQSMTPTVVAQRLVRALVNVAFVHSSYPKELQASAALNIASTGIVSGCYGLSHEVRALLGIALCHRWGGELPDKETRDSIISIVHPRERAWWAVYCGLVMHVIGGVYPGGNLRDPSLKFAIKHERSDSFTLELQVSRDSVATAAATVRARINGLEKKVRKSMREFGPSIAKKVTVEVTWV